MSYQCPIPGCPADHESKYQVCLPSNLQLSELIQDWALQIERAYSHLPSSEFPGPPTDLVARMRAKAANLLTSPVETPKASSPFGRDADWVLAIGHALGLDSGYEVPIVPEPEPFKRLFAEVRRRVSEVTTRATCQACGKSAASKERNGCHTIGCQFAVETSSDVVAKNIQISGKRCRITGAPECVFYPSCACGHADDDQNSTAKTTSSQAPIAKVKVYGHLPASVELYAPGLPPGEHDLYCEPPAPSGQKVPFLETSSDAEDAAKWRALRNCPRMTAMGWAGLGPHLNDQGVAHITLNLWTHAAPDERGEEYVREYLDQFVALLRRTESRTSGWTIEVQTEDGWIRHALAHAWESKADARQQLNDLMHRFRTMTFRLRQVGTSEKTAAEQLEHSLKTLPSDLVALDSAKRVSAKTMNLQIDAQHPEKTEAPLGFEIQCEVCKLTAIMPYTDSTNRFIATKHADGWMLYPKRLCPKCQPERASAYCEDDRCPINAEHEHWTDAEGIRRVRYAGNGPGSQP